MSAKPSRRHYYWLTGIILLGAVLRFWQLDLKALWPDEVITALFSLGRSYDNVPLKTFFVLDRLQGIFTLRAGVSCPQIAQTVATESVHPPLFFCLMHRWLTWLNPVAQPLAWKLRALAALTGVGAIAASYGLNRVAFSPAAGLMAAALMAVSPFAVYLSQEARHYTLPMLLIILALIGLVQIQQQLEQQRPRPLTWLGWVAVNGLGFYVHYFFILAFVAQTIALAGWMWLHRASARAWGLVSLAVTGVVLSYLPWLPTLLGHFRRPETEWLELSRDRGLEQLAPLYQTLAGWVIMAIALPVENQPLWLMVSATLVMLVFTGWLGWQGLRGIKRLWRTPDHQATLLLASFTICVLLQFLAIVYLFGKDLTVAPRYNFTYYPGICALLGASLVNLPRHASKIKSPYRALSSPQQFSVLLVGLLSSLFVVSGLVFHKPFAPRQVAGDISQAPLPLAVMVGYDTLQDVALGLSYALELHKRYPQPGQEPTFAFFDQSLRVAAWNNLPQLQHLQKAGSLDLWVITPRRKPTEFPRQLTLTGESRGRDEIQLTCALNGQYRRVFGVPYQRYRCS